MLGLQWGESIYDLVAEMLFECPAVASILCAITHRDNISIPALPNDYCSVKEGKKELDVVHGHDCRIWSI